MKRDLPFPMPRVAQTTGGAMALRVPLVSLAIALPGSSAGMCRRQR